MGEDELEHDDVRLRDVETADIATFFDQQLDEDARKMAAFAVRDRDPFIAHWQSVLNIDEIGKKTIIAGGDVAGNIVSFDRDGKREVGYWLGRAFWGRGIAGRALAAYLDFETARPLYAGVAEHNIGSRRVLEKCGFMRIGEEDWLDDDSGDAIVGLIYVLDE